MIFEWVPAGVPPLLIRDEEVELVTSFKYVRIFFDSSSTFLFQDHSHQKASKVHNIANATFTLNNYIGALPPKEGIILYKAQIDPYLVYGCEVAVALDVSLPALSELEGVQHMYL
jgi:hypothetical protein